MQKARRLSFLKKSWGLALIVIGAVIIFTSVTYQQYYVLPLFKHQTAANYGQIVATNERVMTIAGLGFSCCIFGIIVVVTQVIIRLLGDVIEIKRV